jgi:hypothetical protein
MGYNKNPIGNHLDDSLNTIGTEEMKMQKPKQMRIKVCIGDKVRVFHLDLIPYVGFKKMEAVGLVEDIRLFNARRSQVLVCGKWWMVRNDVINGIEILETKEKSR